MSTQRREWLAGMAIALGVALVAGGCGPGIGGTGTGTTAALTAFQASPTPVCSSGFADRLDCPQPGAMNPLPASGTGVVRFVDASGNVVLEFDGNDARLAAACQRLQFDGTFAARAGVVEPAFVGSARIEAIATDVLAVLSVRRADPAGLTAELRDIGGNTLIAPLILQRAGAVLPPPGPC